MRNIIFILTLLFVTVVNAQNNVTGSVTGNDGLPVIQATVTLQQKCDSVKELRVVTDNDGKFTINVDKGKYILSISSVGYEKYKSDLSVDGSKDLGIIKLDLSSELLDEVTVMANYSEVKQNGDIMIKVKGNPLARGKNTIDFLRLIGGIAVSDDGISVRGRKDTKIYIDDQQITFDQLKAIDPELIARIEIVPHADASYGVNASGGVIKIHLREKLGLLGSASLNSNANHDGIRDAAPSLSLLFSSGKLSIRNYVWARPFSHYITTNRQDEYTGDALTSQTFTKSTAEDKSLYESLSLKYSFSKLDRLDIYGGMSLLWNDKVQTDKYDDNFLKTQNGGKPSYYSVGLQYKRWFGKDSLSYFHFRSDYNSSNEYSKFNYLQNGTADIARMQAYSDVFSVEPLLYIHFKNGAALKTGIDYQYMSDRHEDNGTKILDYIPTGHYTHEGTDIGAWADYSMSIGKKFYIQAGLNYHGTRSKHYDYLNSGNNIKYWEDGLYPTVNMQWTVNDEKWSFLNIGYRHIYSLPNYNYKLPTVTWINKNRYSVGNTELTKESYDMFSVYYAFNRNWGVWYNLNYGDNLVRVLMHQDENRPGVYYTSPENAGWELSHNIGLSYSGQLFDFWYTNTRLEAVTSRECMPGERIDNTYVNINSNNNFTVTKNLGFYIWFFAKSKTRSLSYEASASYGSSAGVNWSLLNNKLKIKLAYNGIFYNYGKTTTRGDGWTVSRKDLSHLTNVQLYVSWNFSIGKKIRNQNMPSATPGSDRQIPTF